VQIEITGRSNLSHSSVLPRDDLTRWEGSIKLVWTSLLALLLLVPALETQLIGPRTFQDSVLPSSGQSIGMVVDGLNFLLFVVALGFLLIAYFDQRSPRPPLLLGIAVLALSLPPLLSSVLGYQTGMSVSLFRVPALFIAAYLLPPLGLPWLLGCCKRLIETYFYATLGLLAVAPYRVLETNSEWALFGVWTYRLHGIGGHANNFATLIAVYFVLSWYKPVRSWYSRFTLAVMFMALVMTQSRTIWLTLALVYGARIAYTSGVWRIVIPYVAAVIFVSILLVLSFVTPSWDQDLANRVLQDDEVPTLTGRTRMWEHSLEAWRLNPMFGYGPGLWDQQMAEQYAALYGWGPRHAHNQFFQTIGQAGLVGVIGLVLFYLVLLSYGWRLSKLTSGVTLGLVLLIVVRSLTEVTFSGTLGETLFVFFVTFAVIVAATVEQRSDPDAIQGLNQSSRVLPRKYGEDQEHRLGWT
jgi:O-antigen ligase